MLLPRLRPPLRSYGDDLHPDVCGSTDDTAKVSAWAGRRHPDHRQGGTSVQWVSEEGELKYIWLVNRADYAVSFVVQFRAVECVKGFKQR